MDPGPVPECLQNLSQVEKMLIARACQYYVRLLQT